MTSSTINTTTATTIEIIDSSRRNEWDEYVDNNDLSIAWQRWEWHEILSKHYPHIFLPLAALDNNRITGIFPLYRLLDKSTWNSLISIPFAVAGGIVADSPQIEHLLLKKAVEISNEQHTSSIILKQYKHKVEGDLRTDDTFFNKEISLLVPMEKIWAELDEENRRKITAAKSDGFSLEYPSNEVDEFYRILLAHHHNNGIPCVGKSWVKDLIDSSMYSLALVRIANRPIVGTMIKVFKKTVSFPFTALVRNDNVSNRAVYWLYWELISHFAQKGYEIIHSGRIPADESVPRFRRGWGGKKYPYFYQYYPNENRPTEIKVKRGFKRRIASGLWRLLPKAVAAKFGPGIVKKFP